MSSLYLHYFLALPMFDVDEDNGDAELFDRHRSYQVLQTVVI